MIDMNKLLTQVVGGISDHVSKQGDSSRGALQSRRSNERALANGERSAPPATGHASVLPGLAGALGSSAIAGGLAGMLFGTSECERLRLPLSRSEQSQRLEAWLTMPIRIISKARRSFHRASPTC